MIFKLLAITLKYASDFPYKRLEKPVKVLILYTTKH
jgi:hypothetical protein